MALDTDKSRNSGNPICDHDQLWSQVREGKEKALSSLFCQYYGQLYNYGYKIYPDESLVRDCIQELFFIIWDKRDRIGEARSVKSYLFSSFRRLILRKLGRKRSRYKRNHIYLRDFVEDTYDAENRIVEAETDLERQEQLSNAINMLTSRQQQVISLKYYDGLTSREIAGVMGINRQSVYNHVSTAITQLQELVKINAHTCNELIYKFQAN